MRKDSRIWKLGIFSLDLERFIHILDYEAQSVWLINVFCVNDLSLYKLLPPFGMNDSLLFGFGLQSTKSY